MKTIYINDQLFERFQIISSTSGKTTGDLLEEMILDYCNKTNIDPDRDYQEFWGIAPDEKIINQNDSRNNN